MRTKVDFDSSRYPEIDESRAMLSCECYSCIAGLDVKPMHSVSRFHSMQYVMQLLYASYENEAMHVRISMDQGCGQMHLCGSVEKHSHAPNVGFLA